MPLGTKMNRPVVHNFTLNYIRKTSKMTSYLEPLMRVWPNTTGMVPGWSPTKIVQMVLISCISRSRGQKIGLQNAIFKNLLVRNYEAQSFHIWYIASSRGPLPKLFRLCPWDQKWSRPGVQQIGLQNEIFKKFVWNYKAQNFHIWYVASSRGPLPLFGGQQ